MLKKLRYALILTVCCFMLTACADDDGGEDNKETSAPEFEVKDVYDGYKKEGNKVTTVYGTVEFEDYTELTARKSELAVTTASITASKNSLLQTVGLSEVNDTFIEKYCEWKGITNAEDLDKYIHDLVYMLNAYNAKWSEISGKFTLVDYNKEAYDAMVAEMDEYYNNLAAQSGYASLQAYCDKIGISIDTYREQVYKIEDRIKERIINIVVAKENTEGINEDSTKRILEEIAFQNGLTSAASAKEKIGGTDEDWQLTIANYLLLEWIVDNVKVVDDLEAEGAVVDQTAGPQAGDTVASIKVKDYGTIKIRLFSELAPKAVENFATHSKDGYYDGVTFHRVIDDFVIQGGDPKGDGTGGESIWKEPFEDEFSIQLLPVRGALCMANSGEDTNGSQFFIVQSSDVNKTYAANWLEMGVSEALVEYYNKNGGYASLYKGYTVFGQVYEGMDVVDAIAATDTDDSDKPKTDVVIESIEITTY